MASIARSNEMTIVIKGDESGVSDTFTNKITPKAIQIRIGTRLKEMNVQKRLL